MVPLFCLSKTHVKIDYNLFDMSYNFDPFLIGYSVLIDGKINYQGLYRYSTKKYHYGDEAIEIIEIFSYISLVEKLIEGLTNKK